MTTTGVHPLRELLPEGSVSDDVDVLAAHRRDRATFCPAGTPSVLVRARSTEDVATTLRWAHEHRVPVVPQGARSGLSGGANAVDGCVLLSVEKMDRILDIDVDEQLAVVQPGVVNGVLADRVAELGGAYGVVNNAALADGVGGKPFHAIEPAEFDRILSVNLRGTWLVSRALYPQLRARGDGRILNIASDVAFYGPPRLAHYVASKGGIVALTRAMARDAGPDGITVNAVAPGITECEATQGIPAERHELYRLNRALPRTQQPADLVGAVRFLLSDAAGYVTGQTLPVDGGFVCR